MKQRMQWAIEVSGKMKLYRSILLNLRIGSEQQTEKQTNDYIYNEEFDPGSGWTLATGLTHASRGAAGRKLAFCAGDRRTGA